MKKAIQKHFNGNYLPFYERHFPDLKKVGKEYKATCISQSHNDTNPSVSVNQDTGFRRVTQTFGLDADVRRYITRYRRYQTTSELKEEEDARIKESTGSVLSGVRHGKGDNDAIRVSGQEGGGLFSEPEEVSSNQAERIETMLSHPLSEEMVT